MGLLLGGTSSPTLSRKGAKAAVTAAHLWQRGCCVPLPSSQPQPAAKLHAATNTMALGSGCSCWCTPAGLEKWVGRVDGQSERWKRQPEHTVMPFLNEGTSILNDFSSTHPNETQKEVHHLLGKKTNKELKPSGLTSQVMIWLPVHR